MQTKRTLGISMLILSTILMMIYIKVPTAFAILDNLIINQNNYPVVLIAIFITGLVFTALEKETLEKKLEKVQTFETSQGSRYNVLADGRTQRYKTMTKDNRPPHDMTVFIPDIQTLKKSIPAKIFRTDLFGSDPTDYEENLEEIIYHGGYNFHIIDRSGTKIRTQKEINDAKELFLTVEKDNKIEAYIPIIAFPKKGYHVLQITKNTAGGRIHLGHSITKIAYKDGTTVY